jgi:amino acid adenylation domain-containing protein
MTDIRDHTPAASLSTAGTLFDWFRETAHAHPAAMAIEVEGRAVCYAELLELAQRLATRLVDAVGRPPRSVGLLASRSLASYVGYLTALRLSATVVPLGVSYPAERNRLICAAAELDVLVGDDAGAATAREVAAGSAAAVVALLSAGGRSWYDELPAAPWTGAHAAEPDDVAYTLFTSGSTGTPKGVSIRHRNLARYLAYAIDRYEVGPGSRLSQTFELTFDPSVFDMFVAWGSGATLIVAKPGDTMAPARFVNDNGITHWFSVPSVVSLTRRLRTLRPNSMPDLRWSLFCGEQLTFSQARSWAEAAPGSVLENLYGPTELTIISNGYRLPRDQGRWPVTSNDTVPIGRVHPHLDGVLLDEDGAEADEGELCVRGSQRFDGYLDPAQNEGRFLRYDGDRAIAVGGPPASEHWYRTGDRVRLEDGALVHLGRLDDQVKLNGYRIELGEIESVLRGHDGVHDVVVFALQAGPEKLELHAVYTGDGVDESELAELVGSRLPAYMSPRRYVHVDRLPVNANGKIDRRRLASEVAAPATPLRGAT